MKKLLENILLRLILPRETPTGDIIIKTWFFNNFKDNYFGVLKDRLERDGQRVKVIYGLEGNLGFFERISFISQAFQFGYTYLDLILPFNEFFWGKITKSFIYKLTNHLKAKKCIFTYEGSWWERDFIKGLKDNGIKSFGYLHSPIKPINIFKPPFPDVILTTGKEQEKVFLERKV